MESSTKSEQDPNEILIVSDPRRELAFKSDFVSLQERLGQWKRLQSKSPVGDEQPTHLVESFKQYHQQQSADHIGGQFANLHEFFQSKISLRKQLEEEDLLRRQRRPKIPVMRLAKDDWNVKCWEDRLKPLGLQRQRQQQQQRQNVKENAARPDNSSLHDQPTGPARKCQRQREVFDGRIDEVAKKLERVREGAPPDEQLYRMELNKLHGGRPGHSWTDLLKNELTQGVHNSKVLRTKLMPAHGPPLGPLGRPIGRICQDDDDEN